MTTIDPAVVQDCADCPSYCKAGETKSTLGTDVGADLCKTFGHVLSAPGLPSSANHKIRLAVANGCARFGAVPVNIVNKPTPSIGMPSLDTMTTLQGISDADRAANKPSTCVECKFFSPVDSVHDAYGWTGGLCLAKAELLDPAQLGQIASGCNKGYQKRSWEPAAAIDITLRSHLDAGFVFARMGNVTDLATANKHIAVDPREWVSDKPVTPGEASVHIRAWRAVSDPEGVRDDLFMPIFNGKALMTAWAAQVGVKLPDDYDPRVTYGEHRPHLYMDHQQMLYDFAAMCMGGIVARSKDETLALIGKAGTGKTEFACYVAWLMDLPFTRLSMNNQSEAGDLLGEKDLVIDPVSGEQVTVFTKGRFTAKIEQPGVLLVDEPNAAPDAIWQVMRPVFDSAKQLVVEQAGGVLIERHVLCFPILAMNPPWDPAYVGINPISLADFDRLCFLETDLPPADVERDIISKHCLEAGYTISSGTLDTIMAIASDLRDLIRNDELLLSWAIRPQIKVAQLTDVFSIEKAYRRAVCDGLEPSQVELVMGVVRNHA